MTQFDFYYSPKKTIAHLKRLGFIKTIDKEERIPD